MIVKVVDKDGPVEAKVFITQPELGFSKYTTNPDTGETENFMVSVRAKEVVVQVYSVNHVIYRGTYPCSIAGINIFLHPDPNISAPKKKWWQIFKN
jgi:hypothetical protein